MDKKTMREHFQLRIGELSVQDKIEQSFQIAQRLSSFLRQQPKDSTWALFSPLKDEPDLLSLLDSCPHIKWAFPVVLSHSHMVFRHAADPSHWKRGRFGVPEPKEGEDLSQEALYGVIVPGLGFDRHGQRMGRGAGFYDRFLSDFKGLKLGVTFQQALSVEALPSEPHDQTMDIIVTSNEWIDVKTSEVHYGI